MDEVAEKQKNYSQKPTVLHIGSMSAEKDANPYNSEYAGSKRFNKVFFRLHSFKMGSEPALDELLVQPGFV